MLSWPRLGRLHLRHFSWKASQFKRGPTIVRSMDSGNNNAHETAIVRFLPHSNDININIVLGGQQRFMSRPKDEALSKTLGRIQMNAIPKVKRQKKGSKQSSSPKMPPVDFQVELLQDDGTDKLQIPGETRNEDAWLKGSSLRVGETLYNLIVNPPTLQKLTSHGQAMVGFPSCAVAEVAFAAVEDCLWQWSRKQGKSGEWEDIPGATQPVYTPQQSEQGSQLRIICTPSRVREGSGAALRGDSQAWELGIVGAEHSPKAGQTRHSLTEQPLQAPGLRVVTYNILADQYVGTDYAQEVLFSYCPQEYREATLRRPLILHEILGFNADIICLQEVDEKAFELFLKPHMEYAGFEGFHTNKSGGSQREGSATFFRKSRYTLVTYKILTLSEIVAELIQSNDPQHRHSQLRPILDSSESLRDHAQQVSTVAQLTVLAPINPSASDQPLCVLNTHLFYHPRASHIRTMHTAAMMAEANALIEQALSSEEQSSALRGQRPALIFCGDLNSGFNKGVPGVLELLASSRLPADYYDWECGKIFRFVKAHEDQVEAEADDDKEQPSEPEGNAEQKLTLGRPIVNPTFQAADVSIPFQLTAADNFRTPFTNYVRGYQGALDYVFYEPARLKVQRQIPLPSEEELQGWIPSKRFPSDHLSVVFDLEWRNDTTNATAPSTSAVSQRIFAAQEDNLVHGLTALGVGGVIAVPTDTLYGLAASAELTEGVMNLYDIKRRNAKLPLAICLAEAGQVEQYGEAAHLPPGLLEDLLPGPVSVVLRRKQRGWLAEELNPGVPTIGIRIPKSSFIVRLCRSFGGAVALTSANVSGGSSSLEIEDFRELWPRCGAIYDGGKIDASPAGSTIIDLSEQGFFRILRPGVAESDTKAILEKYGIAQRQES